jgi:hypothetical protein
MRWRNENGKEGTKKLGKMESEFPKRTHGYYSKPTFAGGIYKSFKTLHINPSASISVKLASKS